MISTFKECHKCFRLVPPAMFTFPLTSAVWSLLAPVLQPWTPSQDSLNIPHAGQVRKIKHAEYLFKQDIRYPRTLLLLTLSYSSCLGLPPTRILPSWLRHCCDKGTRKSAIKHRKLIIKLSGKTVYWNPWKLLLAGTNLFHELAQQT